MNVFNLQHARKFRTATEPRHTNRLGGIPPLMTGTIAIYEFTVSLHCARNSDFVPIRTIEAAVIPLFRNPKRYD
jgi:hypothetical protein